MNAREWLSEFAQRLGTEPPDDDEFKAVLELAAEAAHNSERVAAPVACWLAAKSGTSLADALSTARSIGAGPGE
jgi:hypothetical protein